MGPHSPAKNKQTKTLESKKIVLIVVGASSRFPNQLVAFRSVGPSKELLVPSFLRTHRRTPSSIISKINATLSQNNEQINNSRRSSGPCARRLYTVSMAVYLYTQTLVWDWVWSIADSSNQQQQRKNSSFVGPPLQNRKVNSCFFFLKKRIFCKITSLLKH